MAFEPIIVNPIGWGHLRLLGGPKRTLVLCGAYFAGAVLIMLLIYRAIREETTLDQFAGGALKFFIFIQTAILFFGGANAVKRAIQRDYTSDMINSHRLTAMSGPTAILGYLTGPTLQVIALTMVNWLLCTGLALLSGPGSAQSPFAPTAILVVSVCNAILCWTLAVLAAICTRGKLSILGLIIGVAIATNVHVAYLVPGLAMMLPSSLVMVLSSSATMVVNESSIFVSMIAQVALSLAFFLGASRRYTRDDVPAFSGPLAYALLGIMSLIGAVGFYFVPDEGALMRVIAPRMCYRPDVEMAATLVALLLVAIIPVSAAARNSALWSKRKSKDPQLRKPAPRSYYEAPIIATLIVMGILLAVLTRRIGEVFAVREEFRLWQQPALCALVFCLALLTVAGVLRYCYSVTAKAGWIMVLVIILLWLIPMFADLSIEAMFTGESLGRRTMLFTCSPIGAWIATCTSVEAPLTAGLIVQGLISAGALALGGRAKAKEKRWLAARSPSDR